jgi:hypothetical protein
MQPMAIADRLAGAAQWIATRLESAIASAEEAVQTTRRDDWDNVLTGVAWTLKTNASPLRFGRPTGRLAEAEGAGRAGRVDRSVSCETIEVSHH